MCSPHKLIDVIKAFLDGKKVQYKFSLQGEWRDLPREAKLGNFDYDCEWRIAPEKKKGWVNIYRTMNPHIQPVVHLTKDAAAAFRAEDCVACIEIEYEEGQGL